MNFTSAGPEDVVLDVACGGGLVVRAFAEHVRQATGIDLTPVMLGRARESAHKRGLQNVRDLGSAAALAYADGALTIVVSRFAFHHVTDPPAVLAEMVRVCAPGGRVLVWDVQACDDPSKAAQFNRVGLLRDPSHVRAMTERELRELFRAVGLPPPRLTRYELSDELENLLRRSFPDPGDNQRIRAIFRAAAKDDRLGIPVRLNGAEVHYAYPVLVLCSDRR